VDEFLNHVRGYASQLDHGWAHPRIAVVTSFDANTYTARVTIQPEGTLSGWLPVAGSWIGSGWGLVCAPLPGDQVVVLWQEGDAEQGIVIGRLWSSIAEPPVADPGEFWLVHKAGSFLKLHNDGSIESSAATWRHTGDLRVSGDVYDGHGPISALRAHYNEHTHPPSGAAASPTD
jgi:hypothetical protein